MSLIWYDYNVINTALISKLILFKTGYIGIMILQVVINVGNSNEHSPECVQELFTFFIPQTVAVNQRFGQVLATDRDKGDEVLYYIDDSGKLVKLLKLPIGLGGRRLIISITLIKENSLIIGLLNLFSHVHCGANNRGFINAGFGVYVWED